MSTRSIRHRLLALVGGLLVASTVAPRAQAPRVQAPKRSTEMTLADLLARPVSPATIASLTSNAAEPSVQARLAEALRDPRAPVRAVAARVAFVTASRGLLPAARAALATEPDPAAANELIRMVVTYGGSDALDEAWRAVDRLKDYALPALPESLARTERPELQTQLPRILASGMTSHSLAARLTSLQQESSAATSGEKKDPPVKDPQAQVAPVKQPPTARMAVPFAHGLWRDLAELYVCDVARPSALAANVRYRPEGGPQHVTVVRDEVPGCTAVAFTLASLSVFAEARPAPADYVELLVVPWHRDVVACADQPEPWTRSAGAFSDPKKRDTATFPRKLREVRPIYPPSLRPDRASTVVLLDTLVSSTGCPRELQVQKPGSHVLFDTAAIMAAAQWRFSPPAAAGQPVPLWVAIEVSFRP